MYTHTELCIHHPISATPSLLDLRESSVFHQGTNPFEKTAEKDLVRRWVLLSQTPWLCHGEMGNGMDAVDGMVVWRIIWTWADIFLSSDIWQQQLQEHVLFLDILTTSRNTEVHGLMSDIRVSQRDSDGMEGLTNQCISAWGNLLEIHLGD